MDVNEEIEGGGGGGGTKLINGPPEGNGGGTGIEVEIIALLAIIEGAFKDRSISESICSSIFLKRFYNYLCEYLGYAMFIL
jgi:uncharacterized spore protein YtfJ